MTPTVALPFAGLGGGALGFQRAGYRIAGAWDIDPAAARDFHTLTGRPCTVLDLGTAEPHQIRDTCEGFPDVVFLSPPCKGASGCLPSEMAATPKYQALNSLSLRGIFLCLEAWKERPPKLILLENVPRITSRARRFLDRAIGLLRHYGYAVRETVHDCGELGGLAQRRRRFLLVARHVPQVPEFVYEPPKQPLRAIRDVLGDLPCPVPGSTAGGPMHRLPKLSAMNWLRLALIPAGGDWRDLPPEVALAHRAGRQNGGFGVNDSEGPAHAVVAEGSVRNTWAATTDPRVPPRREGSVGVTGWGSPSTTVIANGIVQNGPWQVADPRVRPMYHGAFGVQDPEGEASTVRGAHEVRLAPAAVADPRLEHTPGKTGRYGVEDAAVPSHTITAARVGSGWATAVSDPRLDHSPRRGTMGVHGWAEPSHVIIGDSRTNKGHNVADPRVPMCVGPPLDLDARTPLHLVIMAADGTWHRPMTTLELFALQGFPTQLGGEWTVLDGASHQAWRGRIGNAVPPPAAEAIGATFLRTLEAARRGGLMLSGEPVWVAPRLLQSVA